MVNIKLSDIVLKKQLIDGFFYNDFKPSIGFLLSDILDVINEKFDKYKQQERKLIISLGEQNDKAEWKVKDENFIEYSNKIEEFLSTEIELNINVFDRNLISDEIKIKPIHSSAVNWIFKK